jgi:thiamine biosynthesis lipoprotein
VTDVHRFDSMGCEIVVAGATAEELDRIEALFDERDRVFSRFRPDSELNLVNAVGGMVLVSKLFAATLAVALDAAEVTDGLVDPTLGAALVAAGYDRDFSELSEDHPKRLSSGTGRRREIRRTGRLVTVPPGVALDLNGVVKSLAVDEAAGLLSGPGFVSAGGDLATNAPLDVALPSGGAMRLVAGGIATSGSAARRWIRDGEIRHHLIDPATGEPSRSPWTHVTVVGRTCLAADICAKAGFLHGEDGPEWLDDHGIPGRFLADDAIVTNRAWDAALARVPACT